MPLFAGVGAAVLGSAGAAAAGATATAVVGGVVTAAVVGGAAYAGVSASQNARDAKSLKRTTAQEKAEMLLAGKAIPQNANESARQALIRKRKISLLSGGDTTIASDILGIAAQGGGKGLLGE
jgi:hypothetical protein